MSELLLKSFLDDVVDNDLFVNDYLARKYFSKKIIDSNGQITYVENINRFLRYLFLKKFALRDNFNRSKTPIFMDSKEHGKGEMIIANSCFFDSNLRMDNLFQLHGFSFEEILSNCKKNFDPLFKEATENIDEIIDIYSWNEELTKISEGYDKTFFNHIEGLFKKFNNIRAKAFNNEDHVVLELSDNLYENFFKYEDSKICNMSVYRDCMFTIWARDYDMKNYLSVSIASFCSQPVFELGEKIGNIEKYLHNVRKSV